MHYEELIWIGFHSLDLSSFRERLPEHGRAWVVFERLVTYLRGARLHLIYTGEHTDPGRGALQFPVDRRLHVQDALAIDLHLA